MRIDEYKYTLLSLINSVLDSKTFDDKIIPKMLRAYIVFDIKDELINVSNDIEFYQINNNIEEVEKSLLKIKILILESQKKTNM
jgi:hypothetical protein